MEKELELLDVCAEYLVPENYTDEEFEALCEEIGAKVKGKLTLMKWHNAAQARRAA